MLLDDGNKLLSYYSKNQQPQSPILHDTPEQSLGNVNMQNRMARHILLWISSSKASFAMHHKLPKHPLVGRIAKCVELCGLAKVPHFSSAYFLPVPCALKWMDSPLN